MDRFGQYNLPKKCTNALPHRETKTMSQTLESQILDEDSQLINKHLLGRPLRVYRSSPHSIRSEYVWSLIGATGFTSISIVVLIVSMVQSLEWSLSFRIGIYLTFACFA